MSTNIDTLARWVCTGADSGNVRELAARITEYDQAVQRDIVEQLAAAGEHELLTDILVNTDSAPLSEHRAALLDQPELAERVARHAPVATAHTYLRYVHHERHEPTRTAVHALCTAVNTVKDAVSLYTTFERRPGRKPTPAWVLDAAATRVAELYTGSDTDIELIAAQPVLICSLIGVGFDTEALDAVVDGFEHVDILGVEHAATAIEPLLDWVSTERFLTTYLEQHSVARLLRVLHDLWATAPWAVTPRLERIDAVALDAAGVQLDAAAVPYRGERDRVSELYERCSSSKPPTWDNVVSHNLHPSILRWCAYLLGANPAWVPATTSDHNSATLRGFMTRDTVCDEHYTAVFTNLVWNEYLNGELLVAFLDRSSAPAAAAALYVNTAPRRDKLRRINTLWSAGALTDEVIEAFHDDVIAAEWPSTPEPGAALVGQWIGAHIGVEQLRLAAELCGEYTLQELAAVTAAAVGTPP